MYSPLPALRPPDRFLNPTNMPTGRTYTGRTAVPRPGSQTPGTNTGMYGGGGVDYDAIRARAIAPSRAIYQNAIRNLKRQPGLGIQSPGYGAQLANLSRSMSSDINDQAVNAEALISDTKLREMGLQQEGALRSRALDIAEKQAPSNLSKKLSTTGQVMNLVGSGATAYGTFKDYY
jgi:hypothetical protein